MRSVEHQGNLRAFLTFACVADVSRDCNSAWERGVWKLQGGGTRSSKLAPDLPAGGLAERGL
jgi:hypothetical protein